MHCEKEKNWMPKLPPFEAGILMFLKTKYMFHPSITDLETYHTLQTIFKTIEIKKDFALAEVTSLDSQLKHRHSIIA